jgi:DNA-binding NarL/FixJ family response regulator
VALWASGEHYPRMGDQHGTDVRVTAKPGVGQRPARGRVLAVDDHAAFLDTAHTLVGLTDCLEWAGGLTGGEDAADAAARLSADLVLMDVRMPGIGGIAATRAIKARRRSTVVVLVSTLDARELPREAMLCGADEIVCKSDLRPRLLEDIWNRHGQGDAAPNIAGA